MKKILISLLFLFPIIIYADEDLAPNAKSAIMIEASTGEILFQKNKDEKLPPASMTKMMSMLLIIEEIEKGNLKWDEIITASSNASKSGLYFSSLNVSAVTLSKLFKPSINGLKSAFLIISPNTFLVYPAGSSV